MQGVNYAERYGLVPTGWLEDTDELWSELLKNPPVGRKEGSCIRGAIFLPNATGASSFNVAAMTAILMDIDEFAEGEHIYDPQIIADRVGFRCIIWTTYKSTGEKPRYRLVIPLEEQISPNHYRDLFEKVNSQIGDIAGKAQKNVDRLGYLPRLPDEAARPSYFFKIFQGEYLNAERDFGPLNYGEISGDYTSNQDIPVPDQSEWVTLSERLELARRYFSRVGGDIQPGDRHLELFKIGCKLWWEFWLGREEVQTILGEINSRFPSPKPPYEVTRETESSFSRTRGFCAVKQPTPVGSKILLRKILISGGIREISRLYKKKTSEIDRDLGEHLKNLAEGKNVASGFDRNAIFQRLARLLAKHYPTHDSNSIAHHFSGSLAESDAANPGALTVEEIEKTITSTQKNIAQIKEREENERTEEIFLRRKMAFGNGRCEAYKGEEIADFAFYQKCTSTEFEHRWIIRHDNAFYIYVNGDYRSPVKSASLFNSALDDLSPNPHIEFYTETRDGPKRKDATELVVDYGRSARHCVVDLSASFTHFDYTTQTVYEAPTPLRKDLKPEFSEDVERWLASFNSQKLLDYIRHLTRLDLPMAALYLDGPKGSGKSLLANGLSRLYSKDGVTPLEAYFEDFNDALTMNPILVGDETIPKQLKGKDGSAELRKLVQSTNRLYKRKNMNAATLKGAFRVILLANNDRLIPSSYFLSAEDSLAVAERFIYLNLSDGPSTIMQELGSQKCSRFVTDDIIAKHALWLRDEEKDVDYSKRFLVSGGQSAITRRLEYTGARGDLCHFLYRALCEQGKLPVENLLPLIEEKNVDDTQTIFIGVNGGEVYRNWNLIMGGETRCPDLRDISECLKMLTHKGDGKRIRLDTPGGKKNLRYKYLDTNKLLDWAKYMGMDEQSILDALEDGKPSSPLAAKEGIA